MAWARPTFNGLNGFQSFFGFTLLGVGYLVRHSDYLPWLIGLTVLALRRRRWRASSTNSTTGTSSRSRRWAASPPVVKHMRVCARLRVATRVEPSPTGQQ